MRGWPLATIIFYGLNDSCATKVVVSIVPSEDAEPGEMRDWQISQQGDVGVYRRPRREVGRYV